MSGGSSTRPLAGLAGARRGRAWLAVLLLLPALPGCALWHRYEIGRAMRTPAQAGRACFVLQHDTPVVHLYGSPREMGEQYGRLLAPALRSLIRYADSLLPAPAKARFVAYARSQEAHMPLAIREQIQATAEAADVPYPDLLALNIVPKMRCSTLAVWSEASAGGRLIMGRNAEYFGLGLEDRGSIIVVYHPTEGIPLVAVTFLGMAGAFTGINAEGVAFGNMLVFNAAGPAQQDGGLPVQIAMRLAAGRSRSADEMAEALRGMRHVIPMNVMVADARGALLLELGLATTRTRRGTQGVLAASNYFVAHPMRSYDVRCERRQALLAAAKHAGRMTAEDMAAALDAACIRGLNLQAVVFEPEAMRMHVSVNRQPASPGPYATFDLRELLAR